MSAQVASQGVIRWISAVLARGDSATGRSWSCDEPQNRPHGRSTGRRRTDPGRRLPGRSEESGPLHVHGGWSSHVGGHGQGPPPADRAPHSLPPPRKAPNHFASGVHACKQHGGKGDRSQNGRRRSLVPDGRARSRGPDSGAHGGPVAPGGGCGHTEGVRARGHQAVSARIQPRAVRGRTTRLARSWQRIRMAQAKYHSWKVRPKVGKVDPAPCGNGSGCQLHTTLCNVEMTPISLTQSLPAMLFSNPLLRFSPEPNTLTAEDARTGRWPNHPGSLQRPHPDRRRHAVSPWLVVSNPPDRFACRPDLGQNHPQTKTRSTPHEGRGCDQADVEAAVAAHRGQLHEGLPEARRGPGPGHHSAKCRGTHRREANHDRPTVRRSLQGPDPADPDAGGVREPARLVGVGTGNRREPDPPGAGRARRRRGGRQPALRGSRSHRNPEGRTQDGAARQDLSRSAS